MSNKFIYRFFIVCNIISISLLSFMNVNSYESGAPGGFSGGPATFGNTCANVGCHVGNPVEAFTENILLQIPEQGYTANETYAISTYIAFPDRNTFGFQLSAQNLSGEFAGRMISQSPETQILNNGNYITHTQTGITSDTTLKEWTFEWEAPDEGFGEVTFFGAYNAANGDGTQLGDFIFTSSLTIQEKMPTGMHNDQTTNIVSVYPNPATAFIHVDLSAIHCDNGIARLYDLNGILMIEKYFLKSKNEIFPINLQKERFTSGRYQLQIITCNAKINVPIVIVK